jgi:hypothetical protein
MHKTKENIVFILIRVCRKYWLSLIIVILFVFILLQLDDIRGSVGALEDDVAKLKVKVDSLEWR